MHSLRQATNADYEFLYYLNMVTMQSYVYETWGRWDDKEQATRFRANSDPSTYQVIIADNEDAGVLRVEKRSTELFLVGILILPRYQRCGVGTTTIKDVIAD